MERNQLEKVPWSLAEQILEILRTSYWPAEVLVYTTLKTHYNVRSLGPDHNFVLCTPGGKVDEFATFLVLEEDSQIMFFNSCHPNPEYMTELLKRCKFIDWSKKILMEPISVKYDLQLSKLFTELNLKTFTRNPLGTFYWCDPETGKNLTYESPPDVYIAPIEECHAELINSIWPHRWDGSISWVTKIIKHCGGIGVFLKDTSELVSWTLRSMFGGPGFLQTVEGQKRKGYGLLMATAMTKDFSNKEEYSTVLILNNNTPSQNLFAKLNYKKGSGIYWYSLN